MLDWLATFSSMWRPSSRTPWIMVIPSLQRKRRTFRATGFPQRKGWQGTPDAEVTLSPTSWDSEGWGVGELQFLSPLFAHQAPFKFKDYRDQTWPSGYFLQIFKKISQQRMSGRRLKGPGRPLKGLVSRTSSRRDSPVPGASRGRSDSPTWLDKLGGSGAASFGNAD